MFGLDFTHNQKLALYALIGLTVIGLSYAHARKSSGLAGEVVIREPSNGNGSTVITTESDPVPGAVRDAGLVICHVAGAVKAPSVYRLPTGARVIDAVDAAGGALPGADLQSINLAAKVEDGSRIFVSMPQQPAPTPGAGYTPAQVAVRAMEASVPSPSANASSPGGKLKTPGEGVVNINTALSEELQRLPGVGPSTAGKIIDYRGQIGRFTSAEQIMDVKGIGPKKFEDMRPFIAL